MKRTSLLHYYKCYIIAIFSFLLGCMITTNLTSIDRTCRIENTDREHNIMQNSKLKNPELVVVILSAPLHLSRRNTLRSTWLKLRSKKYPNFKFKHYFVIGNLGLSYRTNYDLIKEQTDHSDMLILPMYDSYSNLTEKVAKTFHWLNDQIDYGLGFNYILKCDDDSFVRLDYLSDELMEIQTKYLASSFDLKEANQSPYVRMNLQANYLHRLMNHSVYWGYFSGSARIKTQGKWKETQWISCDRYIPYAVGGGYVVSKELVTYIANNLNNLRYFNSEDISVGFWLAPVNNILRIHDIRFDTEWTTRGCKNQYIVSHNIPEKDIMSMYVNLVNTNKLCDKEVVKRHSYYYNWTVPPSQCCSKAIS